MKLYEAGAYQPEAEASFQEISRVVLEVLPWAKVEHIGASSIPGAISKGDLDICVMVPANLHADAVDKLQSLGYAIKQDTLRTAELCMLESSTHTRDVALQVIAEGSEFEFFIRFRDKLRGDPSLVAAYNQIKELNKDRGPAEYRKAKREFIEAVQDS